MRISRMHAVAALVLMLPAAALAADRTETVKFKPGTFSALQKGTVKGDDTATYLLDAREGQVMQVLFSPSNRSCYFNAAAPRGDGLAFDGTMSGNEFSSNLTATGTYRFQVFLMRNAARRGETCKYSISFEVTG